MWFHELASAYSMKITAQNYHVQVKYKENTMFKLTFNNVELSLYLSLRYFFFKIYDPRRTSKQLRNDEFKLNLPYACNGYINEIAIIRENLYNDRYLFVTRNKYKYFYLFILYIIIVEYYLPTSFLRVY